MSNNIQISCSLCFNQLNDKDNKYKCADKKCDIYACVECIEDLIVFSMKSNLLPKCISNNCNGIYILSNLKNISLQALKKYEEACFNYFMKNNSDTVKKRIEEQKMLDIIRNERLKFLEQKFPKGINLVAKLTFKDKLRQLDKQKSEIINKKLKNASKSCLSLICGGFLDDNFICMTCQIEFCKKCEKKSNENHQCKQEDLDSVNLINNMIHCPGCKLPVFKNEGCDSITCSVCKTNFLYSTGKIGGHGSSNAAIKIDVAKKVNISDKFSEIIPEECLPLILHIEALQPPFKSKDSLLTPIKSYLQSNKNKNVCAKNLAKQIDIYTKYKYNSIDYHKYLNEIDDKLENKDFNGLKDRLTNIVNILKQY